MEEKIESYDFSFFKPTTRLAKFNRNITLSLVSVWAIGIFGFHILLKIVEKPTPEDSYIAYESVWNKISNGTASPADEKVFISSALSVLGKLSVNDNDKVALENVMSQFVIKLVPDSLKINFSEKINAFTAVKNDSLTRLSDKDYIETKNLLADFASGFLGIKSYSVHAKLLPFILSNSSIRAFNEEDISKVPAIMAKYLIHNQSFLTDFKLLGFPFHYFYTAVFLLILFVGLCWLYCYRTDKTLIKLNVTESI